MKLWHSPQRTTTKAVRSEKYGISIPFTETSSAKMAVLHTGAFAGGSSTKYTQFFNHRNSETNFYFAHLYGGCLYIGPLSRGMVWHGRRTFVGLDSRTGTGLVSHWGSGDMLFCRHYSGVDFANQSHEFYFIGIGRHMAGCEHGFCV